MTARSSVAGRLARSLRARLGERVPPLPKPRTLAASLARRLRQRAAELESRRGRP
jgi:hypothetical protein